MDAALTAQTAQHLPQRHVLHLLTF
jgi:hypothetical protein